MFGLCPIEIYTTRVYSIPMEQPELFAGEGPECFAQAEIPDGLFELSADAYYSALYAQMSELPIEREISRFIGKVIKAGIVPEGDGSAYARVSAARAASDRGDPDTLTVLNAAYKVQHEIHRLTGLLRFTPNDGGIYIARCSPDHYILPGLAEHFTLRFGETPWAIIDEKRSLCLCGEKYMPPKIVPLDVFLSPAPAGESSKDVWEDLWRLYHRSVNNEAKKNLRLQRQFMPLRYQKYLPEKK